MYYTDSHEWVKVEGTKGTVGITSYAQEELGAIVFVQLPKVGQVVSVGEEICVLESTKAAADVYAPISGTICAINEQVVQTPTNINQDPEATGWLFEISLSDSSELKNLLTLSQYRAIVS